MGGSRGASIPTAPPEALPPSSLQVVGSALMPASLSSSYIDSLHKMSLLMRFHQATTQQHYCYGHFFIWFLLYVWPQLTTLKLRKLRSQLLPMKLTPSLILSHSPLGELWNRIKNKDTCWGRSWQRSSLNSEVGWWESCDYFYLRVLKFWCCHQWHLTSHLVNS